MTSYQLVVSVNMNQFGDNYSEPNKMLIFDTVTEKSVSATNTIASQPLQSGDTMVDHMYRNPTTMSVSGTFSLNGKYWDDKTYGFIGNESDRLTQIQTLFEKIKDEGFLCDLMTIENSNDKLNENNTRFKIRNNMALTSISWTENQNSMRFNFTFTEVISVSTQDYVELSDEMRKEFDLPYISSPQASNLGSVLANTGQLQNVILETLYKNGYIKDDFIRAVSELSEGNVYGIKTYFIQGITSLGVALGVVIATAKVAALLAKIGFVAAASTTVVPVGIAIGAIAGIAAFVVLGIFAFKKRKAQKEKKRKEALAFKLINGSPIQDAKRLQNLLDDIQTIVSNTQSNIEAYNFTSDSFNQTLIININGEYYYLYPYADNTNSEQFAGIKVENQKGEIVADNINVVTKFNDLNRNQNLWFKDTSKQYEVYLINPSLNEEINSSQEAIDNVKNKLTTYLILVSKGDISKNVDNLSSVIMNGIYSYGFE